MHQAVRHHLVVDISLKEVPRLCKDTTLVHLDTLVVHLHLGIPVAHLLGILVAHLLGTQAARLLLGIQVDHLRLGMVLQVEHRQEGRILVVEEHRIRGTREMGLHQDTRRLLLHI